MAYRTKMSRFTAAQALRLIFDAIKRLSGVIYDPGHVFCVPFFYFSNLIFKKYRIPYLITLDDEQIY